MIDKWSEKDWWDGDEESRRKRKHEWLRRYGEMSWLPPEVESRDFSTDSPPMRPGKTILICMRGEAAEPDTEIRRLMRLASDGEDPSELLEKFAAHCDTGLMVSRNDATVTIRLVSGTLRTHKIENILGCVTPPKERGETR